MSFILKNGSVVLNAKLTTQGRQLLASGALTFDNYTIGDSEIDYRFAEDTDFTLDQSRILRPKDNAPQQKYFLYKNTSDIDPFYSIGGVSPIRVKVVNRAKERGFFAGDTTNGFTAQTSATYVRQPARIALSAITGSSTVRILQDSPYSLVYEPREDDLLYIDFRNPKTNENPTIGIIDKNKVNPHLFYKIESKTGTINTNTLEVALDRPLPNYSGGTGLTGYSKCIIYAGGDAIANFYSANEPSTYWNDNTLAFNASCNIAEDEVAVWNMNIVHSEDIAGKSSSYESYGNFGSSGYTGFKNFISETFDDPSQKAIGIIHYSNNTINNYYGELFKDNSLVLELPTVVYDKSTSNTVGLTLRCDTTKKTVLVGQDANNINSVYYDLIDNNSNIVGKVFNELQVIVIEDEEILAAMSYKSNRNWTYPELTNEGNTNGSVNKINVFSGSTEKYYVTYLFENTKAYSETGTSFGYTTALHNQKYTEFTPSLNSDDTLNNNQVLRFSLNSDNLYYLTDNNNFSSGTGFTFNKFKILYQKVSSTATRPSPSAWLEYDYTSRLSNYSTWSGNSIPSSAFNSQIYELDKTLLSAGTNYNLANYINIPTTSEGDKLQFGDENFFFGNIKTDIEATVFKTRFTLVLNGNQFNSSRNPTWNNTNQSVYVNELNIYSIQGNQNVLVANAKLNYPIEKTVNKTRVIELTIDF